MIRLNRTIAFLMLFTAGVPAAAQTLSDRLAQVLAEADLSGSVIVTKSGSTVHSAGYGMANRELGVPNTPQTKFRIGSITKQFTAMGILILQDRDKLDVHDPVGKHVKDVPESWRSLTIHQLLTHTSGIMHSWALPDFAATMAMPTTLDETLERFFDQPLVFEPGTDFAYSGVGYFLLAKVIEVVSGQPYSEFLKSEIFEPLAMHDTGADRHEVLLPQRASGYVRREDGTVRNAPHIFMPILTGGGNLYSTVVDMARWNRALAKHALVPDQAYTAMYRPEREGYAYGWRVRLFHGRELLVHSGRVPGFKAINFRIPEEEIDVVILTNITPGEPREVAKALAEVMLNDSDGEPESQVPK